MTGTRLENRFGENFGAFLIPRGKTGVNLKTIVSSGDKGIPWEHVSISVLNQDRCPTWEEMSFIKSIFWLPTETVIQFHVPDNEHRNVHPYTLHLWRPLNTEIPRPPSITVG
jgi:hypothetical protein